jgi:hypothetical protein
MSIQMAQAAIGVGTAIFGHMTAREQAKHKRENQRHGNAIRALNANLQRNQLELQEIDIRNANRDASKSIQLKTMQEQAMAKVGAAASGVTGGSVSAVMRGLQRTSMLTQARRMENTSAQFRSVGQSRRNVNVGQIVGEDRTQISSPGIGSLLLNMGTAVGESYFDNKFDANSSADQGLVGNLFSRFYDKK